MTYMDAPPSSSAHFEVGKHVLRVENGVVQMSYSGHVSIDEAKGLQDALFEAGDRFGKLAALIDLNGLGSIDAGARAQFARPSRPYPVYAVAYYGGTFASRVLLRTVLRAGKVIAPKSFSFDVDIFDTKEEARRFLETARMKKAPAE
jgi:hypothetical protein